MDRRSVRVSDLIDAGVLLINDGHRMRNEELGTTGIPFVRGGDIQGGIVQTNVVDHLRTEFLPQLRAKLLAPDDVAFITKGTVGRVGRVRPNTPPFVVAPQVCFWRSLNREVLDPTFLYYLLVGREFQDQLDAVKTHGSMAADYVSLSDQQGFRLTIPAVDEQRTIGSVLGALDDKVELNRRMNETLEEMARSLFKSWFVDRDRTDGEIPTSWSTSTLASVCTTAGGEVQTGPFGSQLHASDYIAEGVPVVMPTNIRDRRVVSDGIARVSPENAERLARHRMSRGDLVYSRRGDVEKHAIIGQEEEGWLCGTGCLRVRPSRAGHPGISSHYLSLWLDQPEQRAWISARAIGATMPNLNTKILGEVPTLLPDSGTLAAFHGFMDPLDARICTARAESRTLVELRTLLLPKLLSGELRIRDAERAVEAVA